MSDGGTSGSLQTSNGQNQDTAMDTKSDSTGKISEQNAKDDMKDGDESKMEDDDSLDISDSDTSDNKESSEPNKDNTDSTSDNAEENTEQTSSNGVSNDDKSLDISTEDPTSSQGSKNPQSSDMGKDGDKADNNGLPNKQQMKAAQDLLRSRWLSLEKKGRLKPVPVKNPSDKPSQPVVDASLRDDSEDFEDEEMEEKEDGKANGEKINEKKTEDEAKDQTMNDQKLEGQESDAESELDEKKLEEKENDEVNNSKDQEELNEKTEDMHMNGDQTRNQQEMEKHEEPSNDHKMDEGFTGEMGEKVDENMNDAEKTSEESGAKRIKEECICPALVCNHLADTGMFIDNTNVTDINDLNEMKAFAKGLAIGFKTEDKDVVMGIIANMKRSHIVGSPTQAGDSILHPKSRLANQASKLIRNSRRRPANRAQNLDVHPKISFTNWAQNPIGNLFRHHSKAHPHILANIPKTGPSAQAYKRSKLKIFFKFRPERERNSKAFKRAEAYMLAKQKQPIPPILNDVLFVLISGAESDAEVHAPVKDVKAAGAKIVVIGVGKDAKIGKVASQADLMFMVPPGAGNAIVNAIVVAVCKAFLMGKPGPNTKPCPCMLQPVKKTSPEENPGKINTEMSKEEYKAGMFHASGLPKGDTSSTTPQQPLSQATSDIISDKKPPAAPSTLIVSAKKPLTAVSNTKAPEGNLPVSKTAPEAFGVTQPVSSPATDKSPSASQQTSSVKNSPKPAERSKPDNLPGNGATTQAMPVKTANDKVIHIKQDRFKPLSKTLSTLGESLNKAHSTGELHEGSYALDGDIQNLLKTIGKLKSQVDNLKSDELASGNNDIEITSDNNKPGIVSKPSSQSQEGSESSSQSSSSIASSTNKSPSASTSQKITAPASTGESTTVSATTSQSMTDTASTSQSLPSSEYAGQSPASSNAVEESNSKTGGTNDMLSKSNTTTHVPLK
ncbi:uncharacterized protein LOC114537864, partial [Dendronephthya gigantea]